MPSRINKTSPPTEISRSDSQSKGPIAALTALFGRNPGTVLFRGFITIGVAALGIISKQHSDNISELKCEISSYNAEDRLDDIQQSLSNLSPASLMSTSGFPFDQLSRILSNYGKHFQSCDGGKKINSRIVLFKGGLENYVTKDYTKALEAFSAIDKKTGIIETYIGSSYVRLASQSSGSEAAKLQEQGIQHFKVAQDLAAKEFTTSDKSLFMLRTKCNSLVFSKYSNREAIACLQDLVKSGYESEYLYYNFAVVYIRDRRYEDAISSLKQSIKLNTRGAINRAYCINDQDFREARNNAAFPKEFEDLCQLYPP